MSKLFSEPAANWLTYQLSDHEAPIGRPINGWASERSAALGMDQTAIHQ